MRGRSADERVRREVRPIRVAGLVLLAAFSSLAAPGCSSTDLFGGSATGEAPSDGPRALTFGAWTKDTIHCAEQTCENRYTLTVTEAGRLRAEVYAPLDPGGPDFSFVLLDDADEEIARPIDDRRRPRRLEYDVTPGVYTLRVAGRGANQGPLRYEVVAFRSDTGQGAAGRRGPRAERTTSSAPSAKETPGSARSDEPTVEAADREPADGRGRAEPPRGDVLVEAEVLDLETEAGGATFVLLDRGEPHGVRVDMRGQLRVEGAWIGSFVIVEVYRDGSRARVVGELERGIGIDTLAEIYR